MRRPREPSLAARGVSAFYLHFIYCGMQFAVVANELNMRIAIIPEENEKSEPFSNRKQVRIFLVWWAGGYREPRRVKRNLGRGSQRLRRALGGTRIPLAAVPTAPPCICRWQRSSLLHRTVFAPSSATAPQLVESTLEGETSKNLQKKNVCVFLHRRSLGGRGWIRTTEAESSRFTVCPHWPLGNTPIFDSQSHRLPVYITTGARVCQCFLRKFSTFQMHPRAYGSGLQEMNTFQHFFERENAQKAHLENVQDTKLFRNPK